MLIGYILVLYWDAGKKMEATIIQQGYILWLYLDNEKQNGSYYNRMGV